MAIEVYRTILPRVFDEMEDLMDQWMTNWPFGRAWHRRPTNGHAGSPSIEVVEKKDKYLVKAELPGMKKEDVDISVSDNVITVRGERRESFDVKEEDVQYNEITYGTFSRSFTLLTKVDADKISATYENGILEVTLPKSMSSLPRHIEVQTK